MAESRALSSRGGNRRMSIGWLLSSQGAPADPPSAPLPSAPPPSAPPPDVPTTAGVLTRTMVRSPVVKWILPAQIRHKDKDDVAFIGESYIEIKEFSIGHHLQSVATKADFDSRIRAARIFGEERKRRPPSKRLDSGGFKLTVEPEPDYTPVDIDGCSNLQLPPQMLVVSLQAGPRDSLVFLFAHHDRLANINFVSSMRPLPAGSGEAARLGAHIAVDPRSRAMAVAAQSGQLMIYLLKSRDAMCREIRGRSGSYSENFKPIKQERLLDLNSTILKMEFLHSPDDKAHRHAAVLALLIRPLGKSDQARTYLRYVELDCSRDLSEIDFRWRGFPLPNYESVPMLLVPLTISTGVLLACRDRVYMYQDLLSGYSSPIEVRCDHAALDEASSAVGDSSGIPGVFPLFTGWARPPRHTGHSTVVESLYLCREDGAVVFYELRPDGHLIEHFPGCLGVSVDTAFACLDLSTQAWRNPENDHGSFDVLVIAGDKGDGGLFEFKTRKNGLPRIQGFRNWSPLLDCAVVPRLTASVGIDTRNIPYPRTIANQDRIFTCADRGSRLGTICEMRFGADAQSSFQVRLDSLPASLNIPTASITKVWLFPDLDLEEPRDYVQSRKDKAVVLVSLPERSEAFKISWEGELFNIPQYSRTEKLINRSCSTIAASTTRNHLAVQVTEDSLRAIGTSWADGTPARFFEHSFATQRVGQASIDGYSSMCLVSLRAPSASVLKLGYLANSEQQAGFLVKDDASLTLRCESASVFLTTFGSSVVGLVGTTDQRITAYECKSGKPSFICEYAFTGDTAICESICVIARPGNRAPGQAANVLCGLRNGTVHVLSFDVSDTASRGLTCLESLNIASTAVSIVPELVSQSKLDTLPSRAIVLHDNYLCRLFYRAGDANQITVQCVWITHPEFRGLQQTSIKGLAQYPPWNGAESAFRRAFLCMDERFAKLVRLDGDVQSIAVPRRIDIPGKPVRMTYLSQVERLAVGFLYSIPARVASNGVDRKPKRLVFPVIKLVDPDDDGMPTPDETESKSADPVNLPTGCHPLGLSGEKILGMCEWVPTSNGLTWPLLAVNTLRLRDKEGRESGCIYIFHLERRPEGRIEATLKKRLSQEQPIYAMAPLGLDSLVYSAGAELIVQRLSFLDDVLRFVPVARVALRSPARHITTAGPDVYVSTVKHSVTLFGLEGSSLVEKFNDHKERSVIHHLFIPERSLLVASDTSGSVRGLRRPKEGSIDGGFQQIFKASFPVNINRFRVASFNPRRGSMGKSARQEIVGSASDGSFYSFEFLNPDEWRFLCFVQNLARKYPEICPFNYQDHLESQSEPNIQDSNMHIDGDILARIFEHGNAQATEFLRSITTLDPRTDLDYVSAEECKERFSELAEAVLPGAAEQNLYEASIVYLRSKLQIDI